MPGALVFALYAVLSLVVTYPVAARLGTALPGLNGDQSQYMWCVDTFWTELTAGHNPFVTTRVLYPLGANLMHTGYAPFVSLFAWPFRDHLLAYLGVVVLVCHPAAAFAMYLLTRALTDDRRAAFVAGLAYGLSPALISFTESSHYYKLVAAALLPYGVLAVVRFLETARRGWLVALSAVTWALVFTDYYVLVMHLLIVGVFGLVCARRRHARGIVVAAVANVVLAGVLMRWVFPPLDWRELVGGGGITAQANANLADYVVPRAQNPLLGRFGVLATDRPNGDVEYFLGWFLLPVALVGLARGLRRPAFRALAIAGLLLGVLACGTAIRIGRQELLTGVWTPWHWLARVPALGVFDLPRCFALGAALVTATLVGLGLSGWRRPWLACCVGLGLVAIDYGQVGMMPLSDFPVPPVYRRLAAMPDTRTLLELPSGVTESKGGFGLATSNTQNNPQMYWQTVHHHPRVGAYLSRIPQSTYRWFEQEPVINDLFVMTGYDGGWRGRQVNTLPSYAPEVVTVFVHTFNLGYIILHPHPKQGQFDAEVQRLLAGRIAARDVDDGYVMYTLTAEP
jgi:hypothetical protein